MASSLSTKEPTGPRSLERHGQSKVAMEVTVSLSLYSHSIVIAEERPATRFHAWGDGLLQPATPVMSQPNGIPAVPRGGLPVPGHSYI